MKLFIAGICGTFMAGIAQLARCGGHEVCGCDEGIYPPMSTLLRSNNIEIFDGYDPRYLDGGYDLIIIGNALSRGNPLVEAVLDGRINHTSGPQWLHDNLLLSRDVIAVSGTHGKTTTSSMIAWILQRSGMSPGFLIGGKPGNFENSASMGNGRWFVIEADEYDCAFFDKRSKFVHYRPKIALLNNLEFDHADIFDDIAQIKKQFHHFLRVVPSTGTVIVNADDENIKDVVDMGCWSHPVHFSATHPGCEWYAKPVSADCSRFEVYCHGRLCGKVQWSLIGAHNMHNALSAIAACRQTGVPAENSLAALHDFIPTEKRLQLLFNFENVYLYEDFAHHPTAMELTLEALRAGHPDHEIIAIIEPRSNTMKSGHHLNRLKYTFSLADRTILYQPGELGWRPEDIQAKNLKICHSKNDIIRAVNPGRMEKCVFVCMSNGSFDAVPSSLKEHLAEFLVKSQSTTDSKK